jgi:hypothetical protein
MARILGSTGTRRRRRYQLTAIFSGTMLLALFAALPAQAVHDVGAFQLEGNAVTDPSPPAGDDWDHVCHQVLGGDCTTSSNTTAFGGATAVAFADDQAFNADTCTGGGATINCTIFTGGGSKDPQDINNWKWKTDSGGLPAKDNLSHAFAARYTVPAVSPGACGTDPTCPVGNPPVDPNVTDNGTCPTKTPGDCKLLYYGMDRIDNSGDAQNGFWFFQNPVSLNADGTFSGVHTVGDVLLVSDFSVGGGTAIINVYKWVGVGGDTNGTLQSLGGAGVISGTSALCGDPLNPSPDPFCGITNPTNGTFSPWSGGFPPGCTPTNVPGPACINNGYKDKSGNSTYLKGEFYEGGINLSAFNLGGECFASLGAESRSSTSPTATLKDFILTSFGRCTATMTTTPSSTGTVTPGTSVHDTATVVGNQSGITPTGTVTFFLCSFVSGSTDTCDGSAGHVGTALTNVPPQGDLSGSGGTASADSPNVNTSGSPLNAGHYCFRAEWPGDGNYTTPLSFDGSGECFDVAKIPTTTTTTPQPSASVNFGASVTDHAVVAATTAGDGDVTGSVQFSICDPTQTSGGACPDPNGNPVGSPVTLTALATTPPSSFADSTAITANQLGTWCWRAVYTPGGANGGNYTGSSDATSGECFTVSDTSTVNSTQTWFPQDSATVTATNGAPLSGTLEIQLYESSDCTTGIVSAQHYSKTLTNATTLAARTVDSGSQSTYSVGVTKTVSWLVTFTPSGGNLDGIQTHCESTSLTITN